MDAASKYVPYAYNLAVVLVAGVLGYTHNLDPQIVAALLGGALVHGAFQSSNTQLVGALQNSVPAPAVPVEEAPKT